MKTLIIPAAGKSSRFPGVRPKWLLTLANGQLMAEESINSMQKGNEFTRVIFVCLREHVERYSSIECISKILNRISRIPVEILMLDEPTKSQSETVLHAIEMLNVQGPFLVKDCDNYFEFCWNGESQVAVIDVGSLDEININNKSYVSVDPIGVIQNIVEKKVISNLFCCGAYGFDSPIDFVNAYKSIRQDGEVYISHIIYKMILDGHCFKTGLADQYSDWGTLDAYKKHMNKTLTLFCDLDGVLFKNSGKFAPNGWGHCIIDENMSSLKDLMSRKNIYLVVTTSRPESERGNVISILSAYGISADQYVMGLPHAKRLLLNDYSDTNTYPTAIALNLERDSTALKKLFQGI